MATQPETLTAEFSQSRNDIYWKIYAGADGFIRWVGYDDGFWWSNIAPKPSAQIGKATGRTYTLDFTTGKVTVTAPADQVAA